MKVKDKFGNEIEMSLEEYKVYVGLSNNNNPQEKSVELKDNQYLKVINGKEVIANYDVWTTKEVHQIIDDLTFKNVKELSKKMNRSESSLYNKMAKIKKFLENKFIKHNQYQVRREGISLDDLNNVRHIKIRRRLNLDNTEISRRKNVMTEVNKMAKEFMKNDYNLTQQQALSMAFKIYYEHNPRKNETKIKGGQNE